MPGRPPIDKDRIRKLIREGVDSRGISQRLGVSTSVVNKVIRQEKGQ